MVGHHCMPLSYGGTWTPELSRPLRERFQCLHLAQVWGFLISILSTLNSKLKLDWAGLVFSLLLCFLRSLKLTKYEKALYAHFKQATKGLS